MHALGGVIEWTNPRIGDQQPIGRATPGLSPKWIVLGTIIEMIRVTVDGISREEARRYYDRLGRCYDLAEIFEGSAKKYAESALQITPGLRVLNVGVGTGIDQARISRQVELGGLAIGMDVSQVMLRLSRERSGSPACMGDASSLPFAARTFDRVFCAYVLDLLPDARIVKAIREFRRVLVHHGRVVVVSLTEGTTFRSRLFISAWKRIYRINPAWCGGCRPISPAELLGQAGLREVRRMIVVQRAMPSEVAVGVR